MNVKTAKYPGLPQVIHGNGAVAHVMSHVCGGVVGYPITPSTEIAEIYENFRADGGLNVWGKQAFFFEPEGEHSAQSGALGAALTGGQFISNASSSQGILYAMESHYVTVGKKVGGFVLQVAARVVSRHSLNVMAGHDDVYALLSSGYTILFGANPQEAADLAAISYRIASLSLIPVANAMDGFATSHMMCETRLPEPEMLAQYLGDPAGRIKSPTLAQEMLYGAKGRVAQLQQYLVRQQADLTVEQLTSLSQFLQAHADAVEADNAAELLATTQQWLPKELCEPWRRQWLNAFEKGTRQLVPALVDVNNPGLTGAVQNQPDFQAGAADHRTHFASAVPALVRQAMAEYAALTGRNYQPLQTYMAEDAEYVMIGLGSVADDVEAVVSHLRAQGKRVGLVAVKLLQPFPEAELVSALQGKKAVLVLERSEQTALTSLVTQALFKSAENLRQLRHAGIPALAHSPLVSTAIFGLGGHDLQPRHLIAAFKQLEDGAAAPLMYLGSQFFSDTATERVAGYLKRLKQAYPETQVMAVHTEANPRLLPQSAFRLRFHSIGGYGTIAAGKLLTDILAGVLGMHSKSAPKYGSEKSGAPTNYYITLSPQAIKITNAELEDVEVVIAPDHRVFSHTNPLLGLVSGGSFILQSSASPQQVWQELPLQARKTIRERKIAFFIIDAFAVAKRNAPTPELATRMMGIAFIGAVAGHVEQVARGANPDAILEKVRQQIAKKFGAKGAGVIDGNMAVMREGIEATRKVDYELPVFSTIDAKAPAIEIHQVSAAVAQCQGVGSSACAGMFDREYYDDMVLRPFREGALGEAPVLPGSGLFIPPGSAAAKDKGMFRRSVPEFISGLCTGCMECALVCPDAAIPNVVHDIHDLLLSAIGQLDLGESQRDAMRAHAYALAEGLRTVYRQSKQAQPLHEILADTATHLEADNVTLQHDLRKLVDLLALYPVARTRPFFDAMEKAKAGSGGLFAANIDPWKCTGCLECVEVCGPAALVAREQDAALLENLQHRFEFMGRLPATAERFVDDAIKPGGDIKRLLLERSNYYSTTGGHGACRGCGEVTAIRLVMATNQAITERRRREHVRELQSLLERLAQRQAALAASDAERRQRLAAIMLTLEKRLYQFESGPGGKGPSGAVVANSTGCSSVYASTFPFNCYNDPWVSSLFQDAQPLAKGIFEGIAAQTVADVRAQRLARLELADAYDAQTHDPQLRGLSWDQFSAAELGLMPTVITIGGDGATYDIGFGALSRILMSNTPLKILVLNTGAYSNTGGQASTSSFIAQDSDLARFGSAASGKHESRKELALIAAFHANVFVCATSTSLQAHFLKNTLECLNYTDGPALMDVYTPCQGEHGIGDAASYERSRLAVHSRMNPVFVHDPRRGATLHDWFSLDGNPEPEKTWASTTLEYLDEAGQLKLLNTTLTPAHFALGEVRFKKQFQALDADEVEALPVELYVELPKAQRDGKKPFIWSTDGRQRLRRMGLSQAVVALVEERRKYWHLLQFLAGQHVAKMNDSHRTSISSLQAQYRDALTQREASLDSFARAMSELAAASKAPPASARSVPIVPLTGSPSEGTETAVAVLEAVVTYDAADQVKCTDCKTCYQDLPELFEKSRILVDGQSREVARLIDGALERVKVTAELKSRIARVVAGCDAEIIR